MALTQFLKRQKLAAETEEFKPRELPVLNKRQKVVKEKPRGGRKWVFALLFLSVILSLGFWFWGRYSGKMEIGTANDTLLIPISNSTPTPNKKITEAIIKINELTRNLQGTYGVYVYNLTTKDSYGVRQNEIFAAASLIKLPVLLALYQQVGAGQIDLATKYVLQQEDQRAGSGSMQYSPTGTIYTYKQMAQLMGQQSDNTAFTVISKILGNDQIQATINNLGMSKTSLANNETTPADIGLFFRKLYGGSVVSREHRDEILSFITNTAFEDRIPAGVPTNIRVAHKIGQEIEVFSDKIGNNIGAFSDGGIVFADRPFVIVILSKDALEREAKTVLPAMTKLIWNFETGE